MEDSLHERGKAIEDLFFADSDQQLLAKMREEMAGDESQAALKAATGIEDADVLKSLIDSGITPECVTSIGLIPLVVVAWADKVMESSEKEAILQAAEGAGIDSDSASYTLIQGWLNKQPPASLLETWKAYIGGLKTTLDSVAISQMKTSIIGRAETVAEAAGGFLGLVGNKISEVERKTIDDLAATFD